MYTVHRLPPQQNFRSIQFAYFENFESCFFLRNSTPRGGRKVGAHPTTEAEMAYEDFERGMGSRTRHGRKVSRRDTRGEIKVATRNGRSNNRARVRKEAFGR